MTAKTRKRKPTPAPATKSTSVRLLVTPEQLKQWHKAAGISHEGNLSMFVRAAADDRATNVIEKANGNTETVVAGIRVVSKVVAMARPSIAYRDLNAQRLALLVSARERWGELSTGERSRFILGLRAIVMDAERALHHVNGEKL